ncbi:MAG TPA: hypothetical protein VFO16_19910 [Pseudonocardiaceae bacterium]|nr:hypothetical protein [Pseudonocardiaceae bacterium]
MRIILGVRRRGRSGDYLYLRIREVERLYPGVPREGELVDLDDEGEYRVSVQSVEWNTDGTVLLEFGEVPDIDDAELDEMGFVAEPEFEDDASRTEVGDIDTEFTATPPRELENLRSVLDYLASPTVGEVLDELEKYDRSLPVEITDEDDDMNEDLIFSNYPSGRDGEGHEFVDLQALCVRVTLARPADPPTSVCILCGEAITAGPDDAHGHWNWIHSRSRQRRCGNSSAS